MQADQSLTDAAEPDHVDTVVAQWNAERPDLDVSGMAVIGRLGRVERLIRRRLELIFAEHDLESWEFDVLATLRRSGSPYRLTPGALLDAMMVTSGAMTNRLDRLERRGLVERRKSEKDGRQVLVTLTATGKRVIDAAVVDHAANELDILAGLDDAQRRHLVDLLRILHRSLESEPASARSSPTRQVQAGRGRG